MKKYDEVKVYIQSLTEKERETLHIAEQQLGSSFNIEKSIGFKKWKENKNKSN
tara:strand:+ start:199 stop:357 length:159 start_codon:yes stop_codon:yes gene_type:complete